MSYSRSIQNRQWKSRPPHTEEIASRFLKPGEALCISKGVDIDLTVEIFSNRREPAIEFLIGSGQARILRDFHLEKDKEKEIDLVLLQNGAIVSEIH